MQRLKENNILHLQMWRTLAVIGIGREILRAYCLVKCKPQRNHCAKKYKNKNKVRQGKKSLFQPKNGGLSVFWKDQNVFSLWLNISSSFTSFLFSTSPVQAPRCLLPHLLSCLFWYLLIFHLFFSLIHSILTKLFACNITSFKPSKITSMGVGGSFQ